jgi:hypothetical protein
LAVRFTCAQTIVVGTARSNRWEILDEGIQGQETSGDTLIVTEEQKVHTGDNTDGDLQRLTLEAQVLARHVENGLPEPAVSSFSTFSEREKEKRAESKVRTGIEFSMERKSERRRKVGEKKKKEKINGGLHEDTDGF